MDKLLCLFVFNMSICAIFGFICVLYAVCFNKFSNDNLVNAILWSFLAVGANGVFAIIISLIALFSMV